MRVPQDDGTVKGRGDGCACKADVSETGSGPVFREEPPPDRARPVGLFFTIQNDAFDRMSRLGMSPAHFAVTMCLARHINNLSGTAELLAETIAAKLSLSKGHVLRVLKELREAGIADWRKRQGASSYWLTDARDAPPVARRRGNSRVRAGAHSDSAPARTRTRRFPLKTREERQQPVSTRVTTPPAWSPRVVVDARSEAEENQPERGDPPHVAEVLALGVSRQAATLAAATPERVAWLVEESKRPGVKDRARYIARGLRDCWEIPQEWGKRQAVQQRGEQRRAELASLKDAVAKIPQDRYAAAWQQLEKAGACEISAWLKVKGDDVRRMRAVLAVARGADAAAVIQAESTAVAGPRGVRRAGVCSEGVRNN